MTEAFDFDVAVVGYGPTGVLVSALLAQRGLSVLAVDKAAEIYPKPRALTGDHELLRILQRIGVAEPIMGGARLHTQVEYLGGDGAPIMTIEVGPPPYPLGWPPAFHFLQPQLEAILREAAAARGVQTRLSMGLERFDRDKDGVDLVLADGTTRRARWLLACDGAASPVRRALGIGNEDLAFDEWWVVVDARLKWPTPLPEHTTQYCRPSRPGSFVIGPGDLLRWELKVLPEERPDSFADEAVLRAALADFVDPDAIEIWRSAVYRFHAMVADCWRQDRVFLLGDAAHQMPPFLGQGLCAGARDAANLAWKLALVETGGADAALLDSYETERKPHVRQVVALAKDRGLVIGELDPAAAAARDTEMRRKRAAGELATLRHKYIPGLKHGLIGRGPGGEPGPEAGALFPQPRLRDAAGRQGLMDDLVPAGFLVVWRGVAQPDWLDEAAGEAMRRLGATSVAIDGADLSEVGAVFADWADAAKAKATIVRPDRYVYAVAENGAALSRLLSQAADGLEGLSSHPTAPGSPRR